MDGIERRLTRLRRLRTELRALGFEEAAGDVEEELRLLEDTSRNPAAAGFLSAVLELEDGLDDADEQGG